MCFRCTATSLCHNECHLGTTREDRLGLGEPSEDPYVYMEDFGLRLLSPPIVYS